MTYFCASTLRDIIYGKDDNIYSVDFSPNGLYLSTEGRTTVHVSPLIFDTNQSQVCSQVWDISKKHVRNAFRLSFWWNTCPIDFSPDSRHIAIGISYRIRNQVRIYSMRDGSYKTLEPSEKETMQCMCFSPDGRHIAVGTSDGHVLLWNVRAGQLVERLVGHQNPVYALAFSPDGEGLVSGSWDQTVRFWNISSIRIGRSGLRDNMDVVNNTGKQVLQRNHTVVVFTIDLYMF